MYCTLNEIILQLLQVPLVCFGAFHRDRSKNPLVVDFTPHGAFCRMELRLHNSVWNLIRLGLRVLLVN